MTDAKVAGNAATIDIPSVLNLLDADFNEVAEGVASGKYAIWLGSGLSLSKVDGVKILTTRVLSYLWNGAAKEDGAGPYTDAFREALRLALPGDKAAAVDPKTNIEDLPNLDDVISYLVGNYAKLLDVVVKGKKADHLLWDIVNVVDTYANGATTPDCEHLCIAILALEGVVHDMASANWDDLIEKAVEMTAPANDNALKVHVKDEDFRGAGGRARLYKFHGCARRAGQDEETYRPLLVGRASQIAKWKEEKAFQVMRQQLVQMATVSPTLMIGLSAQDANVQTVFTEGQAKMGWIFPAHPPAFVFAEQEIGASQGTLLKCVYGDAAYEKDPASIEGGARLQAFAKPTLLGLVLYTIARKLVAFLGRANAPNLTLGERAKLAAGLTTLRNAVAASAGNERLTFVEKLISQASRLMRIFRGTVENEGKYIPLGILPVGGEHTEPNFASSGLPEFGALLGVLGHGALNGAWSIGLPGDGLNSGSLTIASPGGTAQKLFVVANSEAALQLEVAGVLNGDVSDNILVYCTTPITRQQRSPMRAPGRTGESLVRDLSMRSLLGEVDSADGLLARFKEEAVI